MSPPPPDTEDASSQARPEKGAWTRPWSTTGRRVSALGFGAYRARDDVPEHGAALRSALLGGVRLVDTSTNYGLGASERLVGRVLRELEGEGHVQRDAIVVVSKVGYWQGAMAGLLADHPGAAVARLAPDHAHSVDPRLLGPALEVSRCRTGLERVDTLLLHNPEYLLDPGPPAWAGAPLEARRERFYRHLADAFGALEALAESGAIGGWGVSSNGLALSPTEARHVALDRLLEAAARGAGPSARMHAIQLPINAVERQGLEVARRAASRVLAVLGNRPLNSLGPRGLLRLADPGPFRAAAEFPRARQRVAAMEPALRERWEGGLVDWSVMVPRAMRHMGSALDLDDYRRRYVRPRLAEVGMGEFTDAVESLLDAARAQLAYRDAQRLGPVAARVAEEVGRQRPARDKGTEDLAGPPLSGLAASAIEWAATRPGVTTTLVGMRTRAWVADALGPWAEARA